MFECQVNEAMMTEMERRWRPSSAEVAPSCPRCASGNTKFCYYNNYSLSQPRYFCKACRRYWTKGGSLRNVPVGGGCRKTRRSKHIRNKSNSPSSASTPTGYSPANSSGDSNIDLAAVFANYLKSTPSEPNVSGEKASEPDSEDLGFVAEEKSGNESGEFEFGFGDGDDVMTGGDSMMWWQPMGHLQDVEAPLIMNESIWSGFDFAGFEIFSRS